MSKPTLDLKAVAAIKRKLHPKICRHCGAPPPKKTKRSPKK